MAGRKSVVRWRDWAEWQAVHAGLFTDDLHEQQRAVARVAVWRSRGEVPISISATAQLVEIGIHERMANHHQHAIGGSTRSYMELALMYSSAIVRCVNGLVDCSQKGAYAMAVSALAQRIGIPLWIVDLRHESTHNQLPSLAVLRFAAQHLLAWLRSNYWDRQEDAIRSQVRKVADVVIPRLPSQEGASVPETPLKDALDADRFRDILIPLLVDGYQYDEQIFPTGALFLPAYLPEPTEFAVSETEALAKYPKEGLIAFILELQGVWRSSSASLLAGVCQKILRLAYAEVKSELAAEVELCFFWAKLLVSNEWRERIKFAEGPIEDIYRCGASMLALSLSPSFADSSSLVDRLRTTLRGCKGIRNHDVTITNSSFHTQSSEAITENAWILLQEWSPSPLGSIYDYSERGFDGLIEYSLDIDHLNQDSTVFAPFGAQVDCDEDDQVDQVMKTLDEHYEQAITTTLVLKQAVHEHVIHSSHSGESRKVLPQQEVERIQNQIEIW
ncbi:hypothetical protein Poli38472_008761 [Pythium oligandrum]|uniref:Uncharacterized protein n=1 Tax=Pythium oligandrum TaxID=41045 RepID=A0A8K1FES0_PYTOL|nr:hypothetical protein Poli38472_008761 [Pythium oligandrum]|eukprot:TMW56113.1 hypothetical protein Poli38472_008761 [Pythium oligandrum]